MSLTTINAAKETPQGYCPVHLFDFTFPDGTTRHVAEWALTYLGVDYEPRVLSQQISAVEALSPNGIDVPPDVRLTLADADKLLYLLDRDHGFRGARLTVRFVFYDFSAGVFSSDSAVPFVGRCSMPAADDETLTVSASYIVNLAAKMVPGFPVQPRCPKIKPRTAEQVALGAIPGTAYFACGSPTTADCGFIPSGCAANNDPLRFGGFPYEIPPASRSREYVSGNWLTDLKSDPCAARYGDYAPMGYGTAWVDCLVLGTWPEANSTRGEALVCENRPHRILKVTVNDEELPCARDLDGNTFTVRDPLFRYNVWASGDRTGTLNTDHPWDGNGDPHGSTCNIEWCVNKKVAESTPRVRALIEFPQVLWYQAIDTIVNGVVTFADNAPNTDCAGNAPFTVTIFGNSQASYNDTFGLTSWTAGPPGTITLTTALTGTGTGGYVAFYAASSNYSFAILDLLTRVSSDLDVADIDLRSFSRLSQRCKGQVSYTDLDGNSSSHDRFSCSLQIRQRRSVADVLAGMLRACNSHMGRNAATGQISIQHRADLATQQPTLPDGSNYSTAIAGGYVAYHFDEASTVRDKNGKSTFSKAARAGGSIPNSVTIPFTNSEREYSGDSARILDSDDINRMGQELPGNFPAEGISSLDQAKRIGGTYLAEQLFGDIYVLATSVKGLRLSVGQIVAVSGIKYDLSLQLMRIQRVAPEANHQRIQYTLSLHDDAWYDDTFGQAADPDRGDGRSKPRRAPYPWLPGYIGGDALFPEQGFGVRELPDRNIDGTGIVRIGVEGNVPPNSFSPDTRPPVLTAVDVATTGGTIPGGRSYIVGLVALDANSLRTQLSNLVTVIVPTGTNTNKLTIHAKWFSGTSFGNVHVGQDQNHLHYETSTVGTPGTVAITALAGTYFGPPDYAADHFIIRAKKEIPGVWTNVIASVGSSTTLTFAGVTWSTNQWAGRYVSVMSTAEEQPFGVPRQDMLVVSNTADTLTFGSAHGLRAGDAVTMRTAPTLVTDYGFEDSSYDLTPDACIGKLARVIAKTGAGQPPRPIVSNTATAIGINPAWLERPDADSIIIIEDADWLNELPTNPYVIADYAGVSPAIGALEVPNAAGEVLRVQAITAGADGQLSSEAAAPFREIRLNGTGVTRYVDDDTDQLPTDGTIVADARGVTQPSPDSLNGAINASVTSITFTSGAAIVNGTVVEIGTERILVDGGSGATRTSCTRGFGGTTAASHANGASVTVPGFIAISLSDIESQPNCQLIVTRHAADTSSNYVVGYTATGNDLPEGGTSFILPDNSQQRGTIVLKAPDSATRWLVLNSQGVAGPQGIPGGGSGTAAPNITSATLTVSRVGRPDGFVDIQWAGTITLPTSDPDYSHLVKIGVYGKDASGNLHLVTLINSWSGSTVAYSGILEAMTGAVETWDAVFLAYNEADSPTASPYTISSVTVLPIGVSLSATYNYQFQDLDGNLFLQVLVSATFTGLPATNLPGCALFYGVGFVAGPPYAFDNTWAKTERITGSTQSFVVIVPMPSFFAPPFRVQIALVVGPVPQMPNVSDSGLPGPKGISNNFVVTPILAPLTLVGAEVGPRYLDENQSTHTTIRGTITLQNTGGGPIFSSGVILLRTWYSPDNGATWIFHGWLSVSGSTLQFTWDIICPTVNQTWKLAALFGTDHDDMPVLGPIISSSFAVNRIGAPSAAGATISISSPVPKINETSGQQWWEQTITVQTPGNGDPNCKAYQITVQQTDSGGTGGPSGDTNANERPWVDFPNDGNAYVFTLQGDYVAPGSSFHYTNYKVYGYSRSATAAPAWTDATYSVKQQWPGGGADHSIQNFGNIPANPNIEGNLVVNPGFENDAFAWTGTGFSISTANPFLGSKNALLTPNGSGVALLREARDLAHPGIAATPVYVEARVMSTSGITGSIQIIVQCYDAGGTYLGGATGTLTQTNTGGSYVKLAATFTPPVSTSWFHIEFSVTGAQVAGTHKWNVDSVVATYQVQTKQIADAAIDSTKMAANAVTAANNALAANSVVDTNVVSVGINKVTYGTSIFAGDVVLSRGVSLPVVVLSNTGLTLFGQADASTGATGLTSKPYVQIQNTGILVHSGGSGPSVQVSGTAVTLWSVNGNTSNPYAQLSSTVFSLVAGSNVLSMSASALQFSQASGASLLINSTALFITNGSSSVTVTASAITIVNGVLTSPTITVSGTPFTINLDATNGLKVAGNGTTLQTQNNISVLGVFASINVFLTANSNQRVVLGPGMLQTQNSAGSGWTYVHSLSGFGQMGCYDGSGVLQCYMDSSVGTVYGKQNVRSDGIFSVNGTQVVSSRVLSTPSTLADVISVLQHHGLSN